MIGVFVQLNLDSPFSHCRPIGYVVQENGCWDWVGGVTTGYGRWKDTVAHRLVYELTRAPIPAGLTLDHLCRNRRCVNPDLLEPVTMRVNNLRGNGYSGRNARKTHCPQGHPLSGTNLYLNPRNQRRCRICRDRQWRECRARKNYPMKDPQPRRCLGPKCQRWVIQKAGHGRIALFCSGSCRARRHRWQSARGARETRRGPMTYRLRRP